MSIEKSMKQTLNQSLTTDYLELIDQLKQSIRLSDITPVKQKLAWFSKQLEHQEKQVVNLKQTVHSPQTPIKNNPINLIKEKAILENNQIILNHIEHILQLAEIATGLSDSRKKDYYYNIINKAIYSLCRSLETSIQ